MSLPQGGEAGLLGDEGHKGPTSSMEKQAPTDVRASACTAAAHGPADQGESRGRAQSPQPSPGPLQSRVLRGARCMNGKNL